MVKTPAQTEAEAAAAPTLLMDAGGRQTQPVNFNPFGGMPYAFVPRRMLSGLDLSKFSPDKFAPWQLMQILADSHTDVGLALWNVLRLGSKQFTYKVKTLGGDDDTASKTLLDNLIPRINRKSGGLRSIHKQWLLSWYLYGAVCGELALTDDLRDINDIYAVNPFTMFFRRDADTQDLVMFQQQTYRPVARGQAQAVGARGQAGESTANGAFREMNDLLVMYTPCDPTIDDPYGRIPSATVINEVFFDVGFLYDLQKIVHGVGAPRYVITIVEEILAKSCPAVIKNDPAKYAAWLTARLTEVTAAIKALPPDEAISKFDSVNIEVLAPKTSSNIMGLVQPLSRVIERRIIKALKMLPILMASNEATTETHGSVQFEIFAEGIADAQGAIAEMCAQMFTTVLRVLGRQCIVECEFASIKTANRLIDANAEAREILNAALKEALGYISHDKAAEDITGSPAVAPAIDGILTSLAPAATAQNANAPVTVRADADIENVFRRLIGEWETNFKERANVEHEPIPA